jgi:hypothetical protein
MWETGRLTGPDQQNTWFSPSFIAETSRNSIPHSLINMLHPVQPSWVEVVYKVCEQQVVVLQSRYSSDSVVTHTQTVTAPPVDRKSNFDVIVIDVSLSILNSGRCVGRLTPPQASPASFPRSAFSERKHLIRQIFLSFWTQGTHALADFSNTLIERLPAEA